MTTLRQPRYAKLGLLMLVVALGCIAAGTWQIARFDSKVHENDVLRANSHRPITAVQTLLPLVGDGHSPQRDAVEFRTVRATGTFDTNHQSLVRDRTVGTDTGFLVVTPLRTERGALLVVRGFLAQPASGGLPTVPPPPAATVTVTARTHVPETRDDAATSLPGGQVESINATQQARRLHVPVFDGYAELISAPSAQTDPSGLTALPAPDLSNPAGGALEPQHFAYVIQWYLFAALALAAPFAMARAEARSQRSTEFDAEPSAEPSQPTPQQLRAAKLADRYGHAR